MKGKNVMQIPFQTIDTDVELEVIKIEGLGNLSLKHIF